MALISIGIPAEAGTTNELKRLAALFVVPPLGSLRHNENCFKLKASLMHKQRKHRPIYRIALSALFAIASTGLAQEVKESGDDAAALAMKLSNPVASLISVPLQYNFDHNMGPDNLTFAQMFKIHGQIFQVLAGPRYWAESPDGGPEDFGFRAGLTLLFPK